MMDSERNSMKQMKTVYYTYDAESCFVVLTLWVDQCDLDSVAVTTAAATAGISAGDFDVQGNLFIFYQYILRAHHSDS
jgi:hypothetical protein